jgi:hypothetical protein
MGKVSQNASSLKPLGQFKPNYFKQLSIFQLFSWIKVKVLISFA